MKAKTFGRAGLLIGFLGSLAALPTAQAAITATTGNVNGIATPPSVAVGALESDTVIAAFRERRVRTVTGPLALDITTPGNYDITTPGLSPGNVPAGTTIATYMLHADAIGVGSATLTGSVTFDERILGLLVTDAGLDATDGQLGAAGTVYPTAVVQRGMDFPSGDKVGLSADRRTVFLTDVVFDVVDQIRVVTARPLEPGITFSMDFQGPSRGAVGPWGVPVFEGDVMTPSHSAPLGPWQPAFLPPNPPGPVIQGTGGPGFSLGLVAGANGIAEVDALSYGVDTGRGARFSVDEWAVGLGGALNGVILEQRPPFPVAEAASDTFTYLTSILTPGIMGNVQFTDGNGDTWPGVGLIEPNVAAAGPPDSGDNLDAVDLNTVSTQLAGPVFISMDAAFADPLEGMLANSGTAVANGFVGGDVVAVTNTFAGPVPQLFIGANQLGLDRVQGAPRDSDDLDALALSTDGDGVFNPEPGMFNDGADWILFSVRRGSAVIGRPDSRLGLPIDAGDILSSPIPGGSPFPAIIVRAESLGLDSFRRDPLCGISQNMDISRGCDDLDALDTFEGATVDTDSDGIIDAADNCTLVGNPSQLDSDGDGYGNACDGDFNNDCIVNIADLALLRQFFFTGNPIFDLNGDGVVNIADLGLFRPLFFGPPGPGLGFCT
ncbi:MAG: hypothetical protein AB8G17_06505 [Gammaproteobacteria bacterium]